MDVPWWYPVLGWLVMLVPTAGILLLLRREWPRWATFSTGGKVFTGIATWFVWSLFFVGVLQLFIS